MSKELYPMDPEATRAVSKICKPLLESTPIVNVEYLEIYSNSTFKAVVHNNPYNTQVLLASKGNYSHINNIFSLVRHRDFTLKDLLPTEKNPNSIKPHHSSLQILRDRQFGQECLYVPERNGYNDTTLRVFRFHGAKHNHEVNHFYLNNTQMLKYFANYFTNKASSLIENIKAVSLETDEIENAKFYIEGLESMKMPVPEFLISLSTESKLSPQQKQIIYWYLKGKTLEETAIILGKKYSTLLTQLVRMREKLECRTKPQMVAELLNDGLCLDDFKRFSG